jgi:hypothetical protein
MSRLAVLERLAASPLRTRVVWLLLAIGVLLRLRPYLSNRSLWLDEALLAINILRQPLAGLLGPLQNDQAAPVGFLLVARLGVVLFGEGEYALRLFPLLCGIASLFLFLALAERLLAPIASLIALLLFVASDRLTYYASESKQYSTDVAVALLLWLWATTVERDPEPPPRRRWLVSAMLGAVLVWFSHPAVFVLAAIGARWLWVRLRREDWPGLGASATVCGVWLLSFAVFYVVSLSKSAHSQVLLGFWTSAAAPLPPTSYEDLRWYLQALERISSLPLGKEVGEIVLFAGILGAAALFRQARDGFYWLLLPGVFALLASGLHKYPLANRLWLFMVPALLLVTAAGAAEVWARTRRAFPLLAVAFFGLLSVQPILYTAYHFVRPQRVEEIKPLLQYWRAQRRPGDVLYVYYGALPAVSYYSLRGMLEPTEFVMGVRARESPAKYLRDLDELRGVGTAWLIFSHVDTNDSINEEQFMLRYLDGMGIRLVERGAVGASLYSYRLVRDTS